MCANASHKLENDAVARGRVRGGYGEELELLLELCAALGRQDHVTEDAADVARQRPLVVRLNTAQSLHVHPYNIYTAPAWHRANVYTPQTDKLPATCTYITELLGNEADELRRGAGGLHHQVREQEMFHSLRT